MRKNSKKPGHAQVLPTPSHQAAPARILVVDDDVVLCLFNAEVLAGAGFEADMAEDGAAGWEAFQTSNYDLVITDNNMPKVSGIELLRKLRSVDKGLPVIMISGAMPTEELSREPELHLAAMLSKPFTSRQLLKTVEHVLAQAEASRPRVKTARRESSTHAVAA